MADLTLKDLEAALRRTGLAEETVMKAVRRFAAALSPKCEEMRTEKARVDARLRRALQEWQDRETVRKVMSE